MDNTNNTTNQTDLVAVESSKTVEIGEGALLQVTEALQQISANQEASVVFEKLKPLHIQPLASKDTDGKLKVNELFSRREIKTSTYTLNGKTIIITLNGDYDSLVKAVGLALNLILDSGDNYIFGPNQTILTELVFLREVTNINLEFLTLPEIHFSQLIETYDILKPIIEFIDELQDDDLYNRYRWYRRALSSSIDAAIAYQNSAQGIIDALSQHNIKHEKTMTEQLAELDSSKLSSIVNLIQDIEPQK